MKSGQTSAALQLPMAVPYAAIVISFGMIVIVQAGFTIRMISDLITENIKKRRWRHNATALILFGSMAVFLIIGVPIAFALGASVWATIVFSPDLR